MFPKSSICGAFPSPPLEIMPWDSYPPVIIVIPINGLDGAWVGSKQWWKGLEMGEQKSTWLKLQEHVFFLPFYLLFYASCKMNWVVEVTNCVLPWRRASCWRISCFYLLPWALWPSCKVELILLTDFQLEVVLHPTVSSHPLYRCNRMGFWKWCEAGDCSTKRLQVKP